MLGVLKHICCGRVVSGRQLEIIIGNLTFLFLMNRPFLSCLDHCYDYIACCYDRPQKLWPGVAHELRIASGLFIFCRSELDRPWWPKALMVDASLSGYLVAERAAESGLVRDAGEWDERWRFRRDLNVGARERFALAERSELASARPCVEGPLTGCALVEPDFPELSEDRIAADQWKTLWSSPLFSSDAIH